MTSVIAFCKNVKRSRPPKLTRKLFDSEWNTKAVYMHEKKNKKNTKPLFSYLFVIAAILVKSRTWSIFPKCLLSCVCLQSFRKRFLARSFSNHVVFEYLIWFFVFGDSVKIILLIIFYVNRKNPRSHFKSSIKVPYIYRKFSADRGWVANFADHIGKTKINYKSKYIL